MESRLSRKLEQQTRKRFYLTIFGTVILLFLLLKYGMPLLINLSLFLSNSKSSATDKQQNGTQFVAAPTINTTFSATNSASISVSGNAQPKQEIRLFENDAYLDATQTKDDGSFSFPNVTLQQGNNILKVKAKQNNNESDYSQATTVLYKNSQPNLTVSSPSDGQSFSKDQSTISVSGKTDPDVKVTVNDFWAIIDANGNYSYNLHLQNGDNQIKVDALDSAGNKTEKTLKVTYSP